VDHRLRTAALQLVVEQRVRKIEIRILIRLFKFTRQDVTGGCREMNNEELHNSCSSNIIRVIKSRKIRQTGM
jgi:hypothetical protein